MGTLEEEGGTELFSGALFARVRLRVVTGGMRPLSTTGNVLDEVTGNSIGSKDDG